MREKLHVGGKDERVAANMEVALEDACKLLTKDQDTYENRKFIAQKIIDCVTKGASDLSDLREAGRQAVGLLNSITPTGQGGGTLA